MAESEEELKSLLMKVKEESEKSWFKIQHSKNWDHGIWSHHFMAKNGEKVEIVADFIFLGSKITADSDGSQEIKRYLLLGRKAMTNLDMSRHHKPRHHFANKSPSSQSYGFSSSHIWMWKLDSGEGWAPKNWHFWIVVLEKTFESSLGCKEIN